MSDEVQIIKEKLDIVDFLKQYIELKPAGKNFKACCPFHKEKTPSFMVSPERQTWHCFGACGEGGDIIQFLMKYENLEFYDALKILAEKAGVDIRRSAGGDFRAHDSLYSIINEAKDFFKNNLFASETIRKYVKERGLNDETVSEFELGLAPDGSDVLTTHLTKLGYKIVDVEKAGLAIKTERGTYWDRFRSRLMFPLYNNVGKAVGFTGRILPGADDRNTGKYVNSPETPIFQKSKFLYGFHKTKNDIRELKSAVLVEGQMDFLMMWQDGVKNTVATSGTALTIDHLKTLRRLADELILSFDSDEAGQMAAERSIDAAGAMDFMVKLLIIGDEKLKDPADVVKSQPGLIKSMMKKSIPAMEYYFHRYFKNPGVDLEKDLQKKKQHIRLVLSKIKNLASSVERSHWVKKLSDLVNFDEKTLMEEMDDIKEENKVFASDLAPQKSEEKNLSKQDLICQRLLGLALNHKELKEMLTENICHLPPYYQDILKGNLNGDAEKLVNFISLRFSFDNVEEVDMPRLKKEFFSLLNGLKAKNLIEKRQILSKQIKSLERYGDEQHLAAALREFDSVSQELHNLGI
ncbi:MAG: DNA primase [Parcubacteria group bacterium Athens0714_26]|nr:MAG: DNA primase [Parcubacteria group bacterium Athens0714_26]